MALNIKNDAVEAKIKKIAKVRGESLTKTIDRMADETLKSIDREIDWESLEKLLEDSAKRMKNGPGSGDIDRLLYDDKGLPK